MKKQILYSALITMTTMLLNALPCKATVWRVNNNQNYTQGCNHCFNSLQAANDDSLVMAGDTIHLEASINTYAGSGPGGTTILNKRLVIFGTGYFLNQNQGLQKNSTSSIIQTVTFDIGSEGSIIKGVRVEGNSGADVNIKVSDILVEGCWVERYIDFVAGLTYPTINNVTIKKSYIYSINNSNNGADINNLNISNCYIYSRLFLNDLNNSTTGTITHCVISNDGSIGDKINFNDGITEFYNNIIIHTSASGVVIQENNNDTTNVHDNIFIPSPPAWLSGGNNYSETLATVFPSSGTTDSILNVNSIGICPVCYTALPGNETFGIFGGADPYKLSGIPNIPSVYQLASQDSIIQGGSINVNISTRSNDLDTTVCKIVELEYFWDFDLGFNSTNDTIFISPVADVFNGNFIANVPLLGLGTHILFSRSKDNQGRWSHTNYVDSVYIYGTVSINELFDEIGTSVYPNPFYDVISVSSKSNDSFRFILYDMSGRKIIDNIVNGNSSIQTAELTSGTYTLLLWTNEKKMQRTTLIKQ